MNALLLQRQAALAGVALLAALGALALGGEDATGREQSEPVVTVALKWRTASVGVSRRRASGCEERADESTVGVVHPVLPCGAKLVVQGDGEAVRTEVVGSGPVGLEHDFDLTPPLAARLGVQSEGRIRWRFAS
jgi:hypothetical protein